MTTPKALPDALRRLREAVVAAPLGLATTDRDDAVRTARAVVDQIDDYLLPRLLDLDAPLLAVVGGSTGAGKSTLVNSVLGARVTTPGVLRPTTRAPVLVCATADAEWFSGDRVLPGLARTTGVGHTMSGLTLVLTDVLPPGLALVDAPDVDSVVDANRALAAKLLGAADLWIFVTTAARYADAVPWELLRTAQERGTALAVVLDRVPAEAVAEVADDLAAMLHRGGLATARLFVVEERPLTDGFLPAAEVAPLRNWLHTLAADQEQRAAVVRQTLAGALRSLDDRIDLVAAGVDKQVSAAAALRAAADAAHTRARYAIGEGVGDGSLLRGEVLTRWQEFVGTGEWMRTLQGRVGRLRDRVTAAFTSRADPAAEVHGAVESGVEQLLRAEADRAAENTVVAWRALPGGAALLRGREADLDGVSPAFPAAAADEVRDWQGFVLDLVRAEGAGKRSQARLLSWGVNGAGAALMIAVFASTAGLSGAEIGIAGGTTVVGQRLLEAVFGDNAVRKLARRARSDLDVRVDRLLRAERDRFDRLLDAVAPPSGAAAELRTAAGALATAREARP